MHRSSSLLPGLVLLLLWPSACAPTEGEGGAGDGLIHAIWEEDSDDDNGFPTDAEPVSVDWTGSVTILGSMSSCGYDPDEDWPWIGDEDNYEVEMPAPGYLDVLLTWGSGSDLDLLVYFEPPSGMSSSPDDQVTFNNDDGEIEYVFDMEYDRGDDVVLTVLCAAGPGGWGDEGPGGDYDLLVSWED